MANPMYTEDTSGADAEALAWLRANSSRRLANGWRVVWRFHPGSNKPRGVNLWREVAGRRGAVEFVGASDDSSPDDWRGARVVLRTDFPHEVTLQAGIMRVEQAERFAEEHR